jgi:hypothetical protein
VRRVGDELDGAGADIVDGPGGADGGGAERLSRRRVHAGRRRFLDHLLVAALERAIALEQVDDVAVLSPNTCTSMWRGERTYFSIRTRSSPKEDAASRGMRSAHR